MCTQISQVQALYKYTSISYITKMTHERINVITRGIQHKAEESVEFKAIIHYLMSQLNNNENFNKVLSFDWFYIFQIKIIKNKIRLTLRQDTDKRPIYEHIFGDMRVLVDSKLEDSEYYLCENETKGFTLMLKSEY